MRWSFTLALFAFSAISSVRALPLPEDYSELVIRGNDKELKDNSKAYRDNARKATTSFDTVGGKMTQVQHQAPHTPQKGQDAGTILYLFSLWSIGWYIENFHTRSHPRGANSTPRVRFDWAHFRVYINIVLTNDDYATDYIPLQGSIYSSPSRPEEDIQRTRKHDVCRQGYQ